MKATSTQQEILLATTSRYLCREWAEINGSSSQQTGKEKLVSACWNGLIRELLPELFDHPDKVRMFLWQVKDGTNFLELELGEKPLTVEDHYSLNPESILLTQNYN